MSLAVSCASARPAAPIHPQPISLPPTRLALAGAARQEGQEGRRWEEGRQGQGEIRLRVGLVIRAQTIRVR